MSRKLYDNKESGYTMTGRNTFSKEGIDKVTQFLMQQKSVCKIVNVEDDPLYRKKDIDLIIEKNHHGERRNFTIEVKYDSYPERNLYFETVSNLTYNTPGCLTYSEAHFLYYLYEKTDKLYVFHLKEFQNWFKQHQAYFDTQNYAKKVKNHDERNDGEYWSKGYAIPLQYIMKHLNKKYWTVYNLQEELLKKVG